MGILAICGTSGVTLLSSSDLLARLIAFDTTSRNSNLALIEFVRGYLDDLGITAELVFDDTGTKSNLLATLGPEDRPGLVLSGHTDVVPADGQPWTSDPFRCTLRDDRFYGRGTADMKGFLAAVLAVLPELPRARLARPLHIAFSYDEEVGCLGVPRLVARLIERLPVVPAGCLVGEPTGMQVANGHKGKAGYVCTVTGRASHSALNHLGVNAIEMAALIIAELRRMNERFRTEGPFAQSFEPPHATASTGVIEGGSALNIVPERCRFEFEFRTLPGQAAETLFAQVADFAAAELLPAMRAVTPDSGVDWQILMSYPALGSAGPSPLEALACRLTGTVQPGKLAFGTEAGVFAKQGIPAIVCGPGSIAVAHKADEYLEAAQLRACERFLGRLIHEFAVA
jgi:acetylornithine deacetylase